MSVRTAAIVMASLLALGGLFAAAAAAFNWGWFFRSPNTRMLSFGIRRRARIRLLYLLYAAAMLTMSLRLLLDVA